MLYTHIVIESILGILIFLMILVLLKIFLILVDINLSIAETLLDLVSFNALLMKTKRCFQLKKSQVYIDLQLY